MIAEVQATIRRRVLKAFIRCGLLDQNERETMEQWAHGGGFSIDAQVRIEGRIDKRSSDCSEIYRTTTPAHTARQIASASENLRQSAITIAVDRYRKQIPAS